MATELSALMRLLHLKPVSFPPCYKLMVGSYEGALLLAQILYWYSKMNRPFYKTNSDFMNELFMTEREFKKAKNQIKSVSFIVTKLKGIPAKTYYSVNWDIYASSMKTLSQGLVDPICVPTCSDDGVPSSWDDGVPTCSDDGVPTITENTAKSTTNTPLPPERESFYSKDFVLFWNSYPKKTGKGGAFRAWNKIKARPPIKEIIESVNKHKLSYDWIKENGQFIPLPQTWLNQRRWEDEVSIKRKQVSGGIKFS